MSFGTLVKTNDGKDILYGAEVAYLYWGKKTITYSSNGVEVTSSLFNIPDWYNPVVFCTTNRELLNAQVDTVVSGGVVRGRCICMDAPTVSIQTTFYVFVPANRVPVGAWGMQVWNTANVLAYHSTRPMLDVDLISNAAQTVGYNCAVNLTHMGQALVRSANGTGIFDLCSNAYANRVVVNRNLLATMPAVSNETNVFRFNIAIINIAFYDQFSSLGNV